MNCDIKTRLINTLKDEIKGNSTTYKTEANRIFIPAYSGSKFYAGLAQAFKLANTKVNRINNKYKLWAKGDVVSIDASSKEGVYINVHPTQELINAYEIDNERRNSDYESSQKTLFAEDLEGNYIDEGIHDVYEEHPELYKIGNLKEYAEYVKSIFPDSKIKDVLYHGSAFTDFNKEYKSSIVNSGGIYFSPNPREAAMFPIVRETRDKKEPKNRYLHTVVLNVLNPLSLDEARKYGANSMDITAKGEERILAAGYDAVDQLQRDIPFEEAESNYFIVFKPEQIHILGSNKDAEDFQKWKEAIPLKERSSNTSQEAYNIIKERLFKDKKELNTTDVLNRIINSSNSTYLVKLADVLNRYTHNNVPVKLLSPEEAISYIKDNGVKLYNNTSPENIAGFFDSIRNEIILIDKPNKNLEADLLHEIIHALSFEFLHSDEQVAKEFNKLFKDTKSQFTEEEQKKYQFKNVDEFLTGILTDSSFQKLLSTKKSSSNYFSNKWEEIKDLITGLLTKYLGLDFSEYTLFQELFDKSLDVIEAASIYSDEFKELNQTSWENYVLTALTNDDKEEIKASTKEYADVLKNTLTKEQINKRISWFYKQFDKNFKSLTKSKEFAEQRALYTDEITGSNTYAELTRRLKTVENETDNYDLKVRAMAEAISTTRKLVDVTFDNIKKIAVDKDNAKENIKTLYNYTRLLNTYEQSLESVRNLGEDSPHEMFQDVISSLDKIKRARTFIINNDTTGIVELLKENAATSSERFRNNYQDVLVEQKQALAKAEKNGNLEKVKAIKAQIKNIENEIIKYDLTSKSTINNWLKGKYGDQNRFSMLLDSYRDATDPILGTFVNYVNSLKQQVKQYISTERTLMDKELNKHYETLGYGKVDYERLWGQLTFADRRLDRDGNETKILSFLSPYKNYQYDRDLFNKQIADLRSLRDSGNIIDKDAMTAHLLDRVEELEEKIKNKIDFEVSTKEWNKLTAPYNIQEQLKAKYLERAVWESKYMVRDKTPNYYETYDKLYNDEIGAELKVKREEIFSKLNIYNSLQEEGLLSNEDKSEQDVLWDEYFALSNLYERDGTQKTGTALAIAQRAQEISAANRQHYDYHINQKAFDRDKNAYSEKLIAQYGEDSEEYINKMKQWNLDNTRTSIKQEYYENRQAIINKLNTFLKALPNTVARDLNMGELYEEIIGQIYGLRDDDGQPIGSEISEDRAKRIKELQEKVEVVKKKFALFSGLNEEDQERFQQLFNKKASGLSTEEFNEYKELQAKSKDNAIPKATKEAIINLFIQLKNMSSRVPTSYYVTAFNDVSSLKIDEDGKLDGVDILESSKLDELLQDADFKKWFDANHFSTEVFNSETKERETKWQRTYQWSRVVPTDASMIETLPSRNYTYRVIKPQFETKKIEGITTDNKGNFLPKLDATDQKYINKDYFNLVNSENTKSKSLAAILEITKKYHLQNQELTNKYSDRLWMDVPRLRKESIERNIVIAKSPVEFIKDIPGRIKSKYQALEEYSSETGNAPIAEDDELDFLETGVSGRRSSIPIAYTQKMNINDVSRDVRRSILSYGGSLKSAQVLKEALPFAEALREVYKKPIEEKNKYKFWETKNNRLNALEYYINRDFFGVGKAYEIGQFGDRVFSGVKGLAVVKFLGSNVSSILTNLADGVNQNIIQAGHGRYSRADYFKSYKLFTDVTGNAFKDFFDETLGKYSASTQLLEAMEPVSDEGLEANLTKGKSRLRYALSLDVITGNRSKTEFYIQARIYAAYMYSQKVSYKGETIPLSEAYELGANGVLKLKDGIDAGYTPYTGAKFIQLKNDIQKTVRDLQGAYAKEDRTFLDQFTLFSFVVTLKRFFLRKVVNEFGTSGVDFSWKNGLNFKPRYNPNSGSDLGFALSMINGISRQFSNKEFNFSLMTKQEKADSIRFLYQLGSIAALSILAYGLYGGGDQKEKFKEIDNLSDSEAYFLYQTLRLRSETETLLNPVQYYTFITDITAASIFVDWTNLFKDIASQEEYKKDSGINKKGDKKWIKDVEQLTGVYSLMKLQDPKSMAKNYEHALNSKAK